MTSEDDILDQMDAFSQDPEKYMNDMIFENFKKVVENDGFRDSLIKKHKKIKKK